MKTVKYLFMTLSISLVLLLSCEKTSNETSQISPINSNTTPYVESYDFNSFKNPETTKSSLNLREVKKINLSDYFKNEEVLTKVEKFGKLKINDASLGSINGRNDVEFMLVPFESKDKSLFIYHDIVKNKFLPIIIESNLKSKNNLVFGEIYTKTIDNFVIFQENYANNKRVKFISFDSNKKGKEDGRAECYKCITAHYNASKNGCETDPICDIACTLNPFCHSVYLLSAIATCTSGSQTPCNPFY